MKRTIRNRIFAGIIIMLGTTLCLILIMVSWRLHTLTSEQEDLLSIELTNRSFVNIETLHSIGLSILDKHFRDFRTIGASLSHSSGFANGVMRGQVESVAAYLQTALSQQQLDFAFVFDAEGELVAVGLGGRSYKAGDKALPINIEEYRAMTVGRKAREIASSELNFEISPQRSVELEQGSGLHGFIRVDRGFLDSIEYSGDALSTSGAIAYVSAFVVRDDFSSPTGVFVAGEILDGLGELFHDIHSESKVDTFLFMEEEPLVPAGLPRKEARGEVDARADLDPAVKKRIHNNSHATDVEIPISGKRYLSSCTSISDIDGNKIGILCTAQDRNVITEIQAPLLAHGDQTRRAIQKWMLVIGVAMLVAASVAARLYTTLITRPLERVALFAKRVAAGDFGERLDNLPDDEIGSMGISINAMLDSLNESAQEREKLAAHLRRSQKLEAVSTLAGGIAHDFNNILTAILGNLNLISLDDNLNKETRALLVEAEKASLRAGDLTLQLLTFAKGGEPVKKTSSLQGVIRDSADFILRGKNVACEYEMQNDLWLVDIDKGQISQVIQNIVLNASDAMPEGGTVKITCKNSSVLDKGAVSASGERKYVKVSIQDSGRGIRKEVIDKIFDPFFTTKEKGNGLGLAITHSIVQKHQGIISVDSSPGGGSTFEIYLPAADESAQSKAAQDSDVHLHSKSRILLMDDEKVVRDVTKAMLTKLGHEVLVAADGESAVRLFRESRDANDPVELVFLDLTVPGGMGGREAVREIHAIDPQAKVVVISGYSDDKIMANYREYGFSGALAKPFQLTDISKVIKQVQG